MTSLSGRLYGPDLWVLVNLLGVLLITVDVEPDRSSGAACAAETENDSGTIGKDDPEALGEKRGKIKKTTTVTGKRRVELRYIGQESDEK